MPALLYLAATIALAIAAMYGVVLLDPDRAARVAVKKYFKTHRHGRSFNRV